MRWLLCLDLQWLEKTQISNTQQKDDKHDDHSHDLKDLWDLAQTSHYDGVFTHLARVEAYTWGQEAIAVFVLLLGLFGCG